MNLVKDGPGKYYGFNSRHTAKVNTAHHRLITYLDRKREVHDQHIFFDKRTKHVLILVLMVMPLRRWSDARPTSRVRCWQVQSRELKTGQHKVQPDCEDKPLCPSLYIFIIHLCCTLNIKYMRKNYFKILGESHWTQLKIFNPHLHGMILTALNGLFS